MQLAIKKMIATTVISSMIVSFDLSRNRKEVRTIKQIPKRLDDAFKIWGDLSFLDSIILNFYNPAALLISSILSIGFLAASLNVSSM